MHQKWSPSCYYCVRTGHCDLGQNDLYEHSTNKNDRNDPQIVSTVLARVIVTQVLDL